MKQTLTYGLLWFVVAAFSIVFAFLMRPPENALGSNIQGSDYQGTSTAPTALYGADIRTSGVIKTTGGTLANVNILGTGGGINFYDATTTDVTKRATGQSTTTILIASLPPSIAAGTYTFDIEFGTALMYDVPLGAVPTTTISWR